MDKLALHIVFAPNSHYKQLLLLKQICSVFRSMDCEQSPFPSIDCVVSAEKWSLWRTGSLASFSMHPVFPTLVPEVLLHSEVLKVWMSGEIITACSLICAFGASKEWENLWDQGRFFRAHYTINGGKRWTAYCLSDHGWLKDHSQLVSIWWPNDAYC